MPNATMFSYDIPETAAYTDRRGKQHAIPNPSGVLRRIAARINLSVWVVPDPSIPAVRTLADWLASSGASVKWCRFSADDPAEIEALARAGLSEECDRIRETLARSLDTQRGRLRNADIRRRTAATIPGAEQSRIEADKDAAAALYESERAIGEAVRALEDAETAAALFDVSGSVRHMVDAIRAEVRSRTAEAEAARKAAAIPAPRVRKSDRIGSVDDLIAHVKTKIEGPAAPTPKGPPASQAAAQTTIATMAAPVPVSAPSTPQKAATAAPTAIVSSTVADAFRMHGIPGVTVTADPVDEADPLAMLAAALDGDE